MWSDLPNLFGLWTSLELRSWNPGASASGPHAANETLERLALALLIFAAVAAATAILHSHRQKRRRRRLARDKLEDFLRSRGVTEAEEALVDELVRAGGEPPERVTRLVVSFDRGIDQYLRGLSGNSDEDRLQLLRRLKSLRCKLGLNRVAPGVPLLSTRELEPGQSLLCRLVDPLSHEVLAGVLVDLDDSGLLVEVPELDTTVVPLPSVLGCETEVYFLRRGDIGYRFRSRILSAALPTSGAGSRQIWLLGHPTKLSRENRRHVLRIPVREEVSFTLIPHPSNGGPVHLPKPEALAFERRGMIMDLSGGGFRLRSQGVPLQPEDLILLKLPFLDSPHNEVVVRARCAKIYEKQVEFGLTLEDVPAEAAAALTHHIENVHRQLTC